MTKIFLDSGDPMETKQVIELLGFLDGQTTNPSLIVKNPQAQERLKSGNKFSKQEVSDFYKNIVQTVAKEIPNGSVSIEVYADSKTTAEEMLTQARQFWQWIPNAHIKYPTTTEGLKAAETSIKEGMRVNMTLVFSQEQAAAVYAATKGAKKGDVFLSPFIGRLDDIGQDGLDLIKNIQQMYQAGDGHVEILAASVRNSTHFVESISRQADIITAPLSVIKEWVELGKPQSLAVRPPAGFRPIPYEEVNLDKAWQEYNIEHSLTSKGLEKFVSDWNSIVKTV
jgi:transaldolase